jgi:WD40 repeat protein
LPEPGEVRIWDARTGRELFGLVGHLLPVTTVVFSADGKRLVTGGLDHTVKIWDLPAPARSESGQAKPPAP